MGEQARRRRARRADRTGTAGTRDREPPSRRALWPAAIGFVAIALAATLGWWRWSRTSSPSQRNSPNSAREETEREPNNDLDHPQALDHLPVIVSGGVTASDRDAYRIAVSEDGGWLLDAWIEGLDGASLEVTSSKKTTRTIHAPARIGSLGMTKIEPVALVISSPTTGNYRLHVERRQWAPGLDWEPDDDADHAQPVAKKDPVADKYISTQTAVGAWSHPDDVDCFEVPLQVPPAGAVLRFALQPPPGVRARIAVLDAGDKKNGVPRKTLTAVDADAPNRELIIPALGARSWEPSYVACLSVVEGSNYVDSYHLRIDAFTPDGAFEFEPNDTPETASALPRDVELKGYLTRNDADWFRVSIPTGSSLTARFVSPVKAEIALLNERGGEIVRAESSPNMELKLEGRGATFVRLRALAEASVSATYQLSIH